MCIEYVEKIIRDVFIPGHTVCLGLCILVMGELELSESHKSTCVLDLVQAKHAPHMKKYL